MRYSNCESAMKFYAFLSVLSVVIKFSIGSSDYGIDGHGTSGSARYCADLTPQSTVDISQVQLEFSF